MSRYEQWKWQGPKGKSQHGKIKKTTTAQIKDVIIKTGQIMKDKDRKS